MNNSFRFVRNLAIIYLFLVFEILPLVGQTTLTGSLLWEITSPKASENTSYLFGTIHVQDRRVFEYGDSLMLCFKRCTHYAGEVVIDAKSANAIARQALLPKSQSLKKLIGTKDYNKLKSYLRANKMGMYGIFINRVKPMFAMGIMEQASLPKDYPQILDDYLQREARENKMEVVGLETMQEQMDAIDKIPIDLQTTMLKNALDSIDLGKATTQSDFDELLQQYLKQNINALSALAEDTSLLGQSEFKEHLISNRNAVMADRLAVLIKEHKTFAGVGAAHLGGSDGIINLLIAKGFRLRPINNPFKKSEKR